MFANKWRKWSKLTIYFKEMRITLRIHLLYIFWHSSGSIISCSSSTCRCVYKLKNYTVLIVHFNSITKKLIFLIKTYKQINFRSIQLGSLVTAIAVRIRRTKGKWNSPLGKGFRDNFYPYINKESYLSPSVQKVM